MIKDDTNKENKAYLVTAIVIYALSFLYPIFLYYVDGYQIVDTIPWFIMFMITGTILLILYINHRKYNLEIDNETISFSTIFKRHVIKISDIKQYSFKRYQQSALYVFFLYLEKDKYMVSTRYKDEFIEILENNNIPLKESKKPN